MKLERQHALGAIVALVIGAAVIWFALNTEWVDVQVPDRVKGPALRDPDLRLKQLATRLGAQVSAPGNLDQLPPPGATLVLSSAHWNLFPERALMLERWVKAGGHLWLPYQGELDHALAWIPIKSEPIAKPKPAASAASAPERDDDDEDEDVPEPAPAPAPPAGGGAKPKCPGIGEPAHVTPVFGTHRLFAACLYAREILRASVPVEWALFGQHGQVVARVPVGHGSVTLASVYMPWSNGQLLLSDNALLAAATLRIRPDQTLWFVRDEARPPLLSFLWSTGTPAVLVGALALGFALWRGAVRFGPRAAVLPTVRRSITEQIRGTANFVAHHGGQALHAAQLRALDDTARSRLQGFDALILGERAQAIAKVTGLDAHALARAMNPALNAAYSRHPSAALALIETARRRLLNTATPPDPR
ncbi:MAG: DUF4350 domain-containing protein [Burkholderiales bacterium]